MGIVSLLGALALQWPALPTPSPSSDGEHDAAVVVGTADLAFLPDVPGADLAATDWFRFFTARGVPVHHLHLLRNAEVTREQLLDEAAQAARQVGPTGTLWLVFIGHGATGPDGDALLVGVDAQANERSLQARSVSQRELLAAATGAQARTVAVFDACFSGVTSSGPLIPGAQFTAPTRRTDPVARTLILAASDETAGPLPGHDRPAFSYLLLGALTGWGDDDGDARVTAAEADAFVRTTIQLAVRTRRQTPSLRGQVDDDVLARGATARAPDLATILTTPSSPSTSTPIAPVPPAVASVAGLEAWRAREIRLSADRLWVRGDFATPLADDDLIDAGGEGAPKAARVLADINFREGSQTLIWVMPPVGGMVLGAGVGVLAGGLYASSAVENADRGWIFGPFIGTFAGATLGALAVSLPLDAWARLDQEDKQRREHARAELAAAANAAERERLGLPRTP